MADNERVDTTWVGLILIGFVLFLFGFLGLELGNVFGEGIKWPLDVGVFAYLCGAIGLILLILAVLGYRVGNPIAAGVFAFVAVFLVFFYFDQVHGEAPSTNWILYIGVALFFLVFAVYAFLVNAPKLLVLLLALVALAVLFFGLAFYMAADANVDTMKTMAIIGGVFSFLGFLNATYLGLAFAVPGGKIPMV